MDVAERELEVLDEGVWKVGEQRVVVAGDGVARAAGDGEGEGLQPGRPALRIGGEDEVVRAWPEMSSHERDALRELRPEPAALESRRGTRPEPCFSFLWKCWRCKALSFLQVAGLGLGSCFSHGEFARGRGKGLAPCDRETVVLRSRASSSGYIAG